MGGVFSVNEYCKVYNNVENFDSFALSLKCTAVLAHHILPWILLVTLTQAEKEVLLYGNILQCYHKSLL